METGKSRSKAPDPPLDLGVDVRCADACRRRWAESRIVGPDLRDTIGLAISRHVDLDGLADGEVVHERDAPVEAKIADLFAGHDTTCQRAVPRLHAPPGVVVTHDVRAAAQRKNVQLRPARA
jgi:hypothetical protein